MSFCCHCLLCLRSSSLCRTSASSSWPSMSLTSCCNRFPYSSSFFFHMRSTMVFACKISFWCSWASCALASSTRSSVTYWCLLCCRCHSACCLLCSFFASLSLFINSTLTFWHAWSTACFCFAASAFCNSTVASLFACCTLSRVCWCSFESCCTRSACCFLIDSSCCLASFSLSRNCWSWDSSFSCRWFWFVRAEEILSWSWSSRRRWNEISCSWSLNSLCSCMCFNWVSNCYSSSLRSCASYVW